MNNTRYASTSDTPATASTTPAPVSPSAAMTTTRTVAIAFGAGSALVLILNALRLAKVVPDVEALRLVAPLGATFGLLAIVALLIDLGLRRGRLGTAVLVTGLATVLTTGMLAVIEVVTHYVLGYLPQEPRSEVLAGPLMGFLTVASFGFILAVIALSVALVVSRQSGIVPVAVFSLGAVLLGLRAFLPPILAVIGVALVGVGILLLTTMAARDADPDRAGAPATA